MAILGSTMPYGGFVAFYYKEYGLTQISSDVFFTVLGSVGSVMNGVARLFWGTMMDKVLFSFINIDIFQGHHVYSKCSFLHFLLLHLLRCSF